MNISTICKVILAVWCTLSLFTPVNAGDEVKGSSEPNYQLELNLAIQLWKADESEIDSVLTEISNNHGFDVAKVWERTRRWSAYCEAPDSIESIARLVWQNDNPLRINQDQEGLLWSDLPKPILIEGGNILEPKATSLQWVLIARDPYLTEQQRFAVAGRWVVLPLVQSGAIRIVPREVVTKDGVITIGFHLDQDQWKGRGPNPVEERSPIFTDIGYDPFHFKEFKAGSGKFRSMQPGYHSEGLAYEVLPGWLVHHNGTKLVPPTVHRRPHRLFDHVTRWVANEIIIPAGTSEGGSFVPPSDAEYVAFATEKFGPRFMASVASAVITDPEEAIKALGGDPTYELEEEESEVLSGEEIPPVVSAPAEAASEEELVTEEPSALTEETGIVAPVEPDGAAPVGVEVVGDAPDKESEEASSSVRPLTPKLAVMMGSVVLLLLFGLYYLRVVRPRVARYED